MIYEVVNNFSQYDGISTVARNLAEKFDAKGEEVKLVYWKTTRGEKPETSVETEQLSLPEMFSLFRKTEAAVHTHFGHSAALASFARYINPSMNHVHTYHGIVPDEWYENFRRDLYFYKTMFRLGKIDEVVAISDFEKEELEKFYGVGSTRIYNGVDTENFSQDEESGRTYREENDIPQDKKLIGYVARLHEQKNHVMLVDVIEKLPEKYHLVLGGAGPEEERITERIEELGVSSRVTMTGWVEHDELKKFYNACDIFTTPSLCEGFGLSTLEAMACGTPVVVKKGTAVEEFVEDKAYLVDTPEKMAAAIQELGSKNNQKPRKQAERYSWTNIANKYLEVLKY